MREREDTVERLAEAVFNRSALSWLGSQDRFDRDAAAKLSRVLVAKYHDRWLADVLGEIQRGETSARSVRALRLAAEANLRGDPEGALHEMETVETRRIGTACRLRMEFERVYAMHRSLRTSECLDLAERLNNEIAQRPYPWLRGEAGIEHAICSSLEGREGEALLELRRTEQDLDGSKFVDLQLRAQSIRADVETNSGDPWAAWPIADSVLSQWWASAAAPNRVHQVLFDLSQASQYLDYPDAAWLFGKGAVEAIAETPNVLTEALGRTHAAALAESAGFGPEAMEELRRSEELFKGLPQSKVVVQYRLDADIAISASELARGDEHAALRRIELGEREFPKGPTFQIEFERSRLSGLIYEKQGETARAEQFLREAIQMEARRMSSLATKRERLSALGESASAFRCLVKLFLGQKHDPEAAFRTWFAFLSAGESSHLEIDSPTALPTTGSWVGYIRLDDRYVIWLAKAEGVRWFWVPARAEEIDAAVRRVLSSAADPLVSVRALESDAKWLYDQLLGPVMGQVRGKDGLLVIPDAGLMELPFDLLQTPAGKYFGDDYAVTMGSGVRSSGAAPQPMRLKSALIVSQPSVPRTLAQRLTYLSDSAQEAESVRRYFPAAVMLQGADATLQRVEQVNPMPEVFHFSGHGFSNGGHGALLLANNVDDAAPSLLTPEKISSMKFEGCRLAVLSACLTAAGERQGPANPESLVRALLIAGTSEVVASRWSVDSHATRELMDGFYARLAQGASAPEALRVAAAKVRATPGYEHPYYWAAFQVFR